MNHIPAFTLQPQSIAALWLVLISRPGWLGEILRWLARPKTVADPSTSRGIELATIESRVGRPAHALDSTKPPTQCAHGVQTMRTDAFHCCHGDRVRAGYNLAAIVGVVFDAHST